ncbi:unnamed protein product [Bemisia tabaci]|uniref:Uncharacterized protein n=1 Tax=Bemisia tabaci TaxID=7038 RepID=A0A9P0F222_BEMTA|nr:unnamed protein product [Bemisia tabaci]
MEPEHKNRRALTTAQRYNYSRLMDVKKPPRFMVNKCLYSSRPLHQQFSSTASSEELSGYRLVIKALTFYEFECEWFMLLFAPHWPAREGEELYLGIVYTEEEPWAGGGGGSMEEMLRPILSSYASRSPSELRLLPIFSPLPRTLKLSWVESLLEVWRNKSVLGVLLFGAEHSGFGVTLAAQSLNIPVLWTTGQALNGYLEKIGDKKPSTGLLATDGSFCFRAFNISSWTMEMLHVLIRWTIPIPLAFRAASPPGPGLETHHPLMVLHKCRSRRTMAVSNFGLIPLEIRWENFHRAAAILATLPDGGTERYALKSILLAWFKKKINNALISPSIKAKHEDDLGYLFR